MKTAIKTLEEKIKDNKIADFSKFYPTGNQEVAHFAEQYCEENRLKLPDFRNIYDAAQHMEWGEFSDYIDNIFLDQANKQ